VRRFQNICSLSYVHTHARTRMRARAHAWHSSVMDCLLPSESPHCNTDDCNTLQHTAISTAGLFNRAVATGGGGTRPRHLYLRVPMTHHCTEFVHQIFFIHRQIKVITRNVWCSVLQGVTIRYSCWGFSDCGFETQNTQETLASILGIRVGSPTARHLTLC